MYSVSTAVIRDGESVGSQELHGAGWYGPRDHQASHTHQTIVCDRYQEGRREEGREGGDGVGVVGGGGNERIYTYCNKIF